MPLLPLLVKLKLLPRSLYFKPVECVERSKTWYVTRDLLQNKQTLRARKKRAPSQDETDASLCSSVFVFIPATIIVLWEPFKSLGVSGLGDLQAYFRGTREFTTVSSTRPMACQ